MTTDSPVVVLFNSDGYEVNVKPGVAIPTGTTAIIAAGSDGSNSRFILVDSSGRPVIVGAGTAGSPVGGVVSIQGVASGTPIPISGSVTAANASIGITGAAIPASATQIGGSDGTNLQVPRVFDADSGGGTQYVLGVNLRLSSSGGSVEFGTNTNPIRIDPTGTTTQPISAAALPLPTGAATEATLATLLTTSAFQARINTLGQKTMANSTPVVLASDQTVIPVSQSGTWTVQPGNTANTTPWLATINQGGNSATVTASNALKVDGSAVTQPVSGTVAATQSGAWTVTANAGTGNFTVIGTGTDNTANSTAKLPVLVARANTSAPTWTDTNMVPLSVDTSGALRITGSISASNASIGSNGAAIPTSSTQIGGSDGTNLQALRVFDADTGAGTQYLLGINLRLSASGGSVEFGTATNPIRIDPTGTTTQPVSGTVTANAGTGNFTVVQATAANLRSQTASESATGSATPATAGLSGGAVTTAAPTYTTGNLGALSLTTGGLLRVDGSGVTQPVSGTVAATQSGTWTVQPGNTANTTPWLTTINQGGNSATVTASNALKVDGSAVTQPVSGTVTANAGTGNFNVIGTGSAGTPATGVVTIQGIAGGTAVPISGSITASNASIGSNGSAIPTSSTQIGGSDGTNLQVLRVFDADTGAGTQYVLGVGLRKSASGGSVDFGTATDPIRTDPTGTTTQPVSGTVTANQGTSPWVTNITQFGSSAVVTGTGASGAGIPRVTVSNDSNVIVSQATAANLNATVVQSTPANLRAQTSSESNTGAAVPTQASMVGGTDGTNLRAFSTDTSGRQIVIGAAANAAAVTGNPVLVAGSDGTNARTIKTLTDGTSVTRYKELATFTGVATDIAVANNKSLLSIVNASGSTVVSRISAIYVTSVQTTGVTGVAGNFELRRITNHSAGTAITAIEKMDSNDSLNASITVRTGSTVTSESTNLLWRSVFSTDEWSVNNAIDTAAEGHLLSTMFPIWKKADFDNKPIILNANEGLTIKFATNSSVGTFDIMIVFTQE